MGQVYHRMVQLILDVLPAQPRKLQPFIDSLADGCGTANPERQSPVSALSSMWKKVPYTKAMLTVASVACEGHAAGNSSKSPPPTEPARGRRVGPIGPKAQLLASSSRISFTTSKPQALAALGGGG
jgi:hypothetical protein